MIKKLHRVVCIINCTRNMHSRTKYYTHYIVYLLKKHSYWCMCAISNKSHSTKWKQHKPYPLFDNYLTLRKVTWKAKATPHMAMWCTDLIKSQMYLHILVMTKLRQWHQQDCKQTFFMGGKRQRSKCFMFLPYFLDSLKGLKFQKLSFQCHRRQ